MAADYANQFTQAEATGEIGWRPVLRLWDSQLLPVFEEPQVVYCSLK